MVDETEFDIMDADHESRMGDDFIDYREVLKTATPKERERLAANLKSLFDPGDTDEVMMPLAPQYETGTEAEVLKAMAVYADMFLNGQVELYHLPSHLELKYAAQIRDFKKLGGLDG